MTPKGGQTARKESRSRSTSDDSLLKLVRQPSHYEQGSSCQLDDTAARLRVKVINGKKGLNLNPTTRKPKKSTSIIYL